MASEQIPYGVRRYPALVVLFGGLGTGMLVWGQLSWLHVLCIAFRVFTEPLRAKNIDS